MVHAVRLRRSQEMLWHQKVVEYDRLLRQGTMNAIPLSFKTFREVLRVHSTSLRFLRQPQRHNCIQCRIVSVLDLVEEEHCSGPSQHFFTFEEPREGTADDIMHLPRSRTVEMQHLARRSSHKSQRLVQHEDAKSAFGVL